MNYDLEYSCITRIGEENMSENKEDLSMIDEDGLLHKIALDDREAFNCLYERLYRPIFAYALSILKNRHDAEEVMQDCFLKVRAAAHTYRGKGKARAWIFTIARNLCQMRFREQQKMMPVPIEDLDSQLIFESHSDPSLRLTLAAAFKVLNDQEHQIILLRAVSEMKFADIAGIMELRLPTVLSKYHRGLSKLRKELEGKL